MMGCKTKYWYNLLLLLLVILVKIRSNVVQQTNLHTRLGSLMGKIEKVEFDGMTKFVSSFLGIPYAKPPVHERRFSRPEKFGDFKSFVMYDATYYRPHCIQLQGAYLYLEAFQQSEDCLYLNIFVPGTPENKSFDTYSNHPRAVMIYIHGGSFAVGGADIYAGDKLSAFGDVIVVTINYRLNVLGFLSNGDKHSGNYGLWDMKLALQWVHDNIVDYGGDPFRVTIFGNSAGGAAVLYQAINPDNRGLFQRVIAQSGSCFAFWALQDHPAENFNWYTARVGCNTGNYTDILNCLRKKPLDSIRLGYSDYDTNFVPAVDEDFVLEDPGALSERRTTTGNKAMDFFAELDFLNGVLSQDGAYARSLWVSRMEKQNISGVSMAYFEDYFIPRMLQGLYRTSPQVLVKSIVHQYTDWSRPNDTTKIRDNLIDFESDVTFFVPAVHASKKRAEAAKYASDRNNNYFYVFAHKPDFAPDPAWLTGATHIMELPYIFGFTKSLEIKLQKDYDAINPFTTTATDIKFSKELMTFWTNFAKTGDPNSATGNFKDVLKWPKYSLDTQLYIELAPKMTSQSVKHHFVAKRVAFWEKVVPLLLDCKSSAPIFCTSVWWILSIVLWFFSFAGLF